MGKVLSGGWGLIAKVVLTSRGRPEELSLGCRRGLDIRQIVRVTRIKEAY
ncbi:MAG: hypothetical protein ACXV5N_13425 [Halobacteriota archaeon]